MAHSHWGYLSKDSHILDSMLLKLLKISPDNKIVLYKLNMQRNGWKISLELAPFGRKWIIRWFVVCELGPHDQASSPYLQMRKCYRLYLYYPVINHIIKINQRIVYTSPMMGLSEKAFKPSWNFGEILFTMSTIFLSLWR